MEFGRTEAHRTIEHWVRKTQQYENTLLLKLREMRKQLVLQV